MTKKTENANEIYEALVEATGGELPTIKGSRAQYAWGNAIREAYIESGKAEVKVIIDNTDASWWIESRVELCGEGIDKYLEEKRARKSLPKLEGSFKQIRWASSVRTSLQKVLPSAPVLRGQAQASWWIENHDLISLAVIGAESKTTEEPGGDAVASDQSAIADSSEQQAA